MSGHYSTSLESRKQQMLSWARFDDKLPKINHFSGASRCPRGKRDVRSGWTRKPRLQREIFNNGVTELQVKPLAKNQVGNIWQFRLSVFRTLNTMVPETFMREVSVPSPPEQYSPFYPGFLEITISKIFKTHRISKDHYKLTQKVVFFPIPSHKRRTDRYFVLPTKFPWSDTLNKHIIHFLISTHLY